LKCKIISILQIENSNINHNNLSITDANISKPKEADTKIKNTLDISRQDDINTCSYFGKNESKNEHEKKFN